MKEKLFERVDGNKFRLIKEGSPMFGGNIDYTPGRGDFGNPPPDFDGSEPDVWVGINKELISSGWQKYSDPQDPSKKLYKFSKNPNFGIELYEYQGDIYAYLWAEDRDLPNEDKNFGKFETGLGHEISNYFTNILDTYSNK